MLNEVETLEARIAHFQRRQEEMLELDRKLQNMKQEYLADMKATFGLCDGEPANVLEIVKAMQKVRNLA